MCLCVVATYPLAEERKNCSIIAPAPSPPSDASMCLSGPLPPPDPHGLYLSPASPLPLPKGTRGPTKGPHLQHHLLQRGEAGIFSRPPSLASGSFWFDRTSVGFEWMWRELLVRGTPMRGRIGVPRHRHPTGTPSTPGHPADSWGPSAGRLTPAPGPSPWLPA